MAEPDFPLVSPTASSVEEARSCESRDERDRLSVALEAAGVGCWQWDLVNGIVSSDDRCRALLGRPLDAEPNYDSFLARLHPADRPAVEAEVARAIASSGDYQIRFRVLVPEAPVRWIEAKGSAVARPGHKPHHLIGVVYEVTRSVEAETERDRFFELSLNLLAIASIRDGVWRRVNPALRRTLGYADAELLGRPFLDFVHPDDGPRVQQAIEELARGLPQRDVEIRQHCKDGSYRWISWAAAPFLEDGLVYAAGHDTTGSRQAAEALRASEERWRTLVEGAADGIFIVDPAGRYVDVNRRGAELLGYSREEILQRSIADLVAPSERARAAESIARILAGCTETAEWQFQRKDGSLLAGEVNAQLLPDGRAIGILRDLTSRDRARQRSDRQKALVAGIARIFREALTSHTEEQLGRVCLSVAQAVTQSKFGFLGRIDEPAGTLEPIAVNLPVDGPAAAPAGQVGPVPQGFAAGGLYLRAMLAGTSLFSNDSQSDADETLVVPPGYPPLKSFLGVPLIHAGRTIGMIGLGNREAGYAKEQVDAIEALMPAIVQAFLSKRSEQALRQSEQRFRQLADSLPQLVWTARPDGTVDYYNHRVREYGGIEPSSDGSWTWAPVLHEEEAQSTLDAWQYSLRTGDVYQTVHRVRMNNGQFRWHLSRGFPMRNEQGAIVKWFGTATDIESQKQLEESLRQAKRAAEAVNAAKSQFLATMSHELRTPMNAVLGMTDLALAETVSENVREYLQTAKESAQHLLGLLNELLDFSRLESGRFELERAAFNLPNTIQQVLKLLAPKASEKRLELVCDLAEDLPENVVGDARRLRQILMNLVGNAIKFTLRGEVLVRARVRQRAEDCARLELSVSDTGIGIPPELQERVFAPFVQADCSTTRRFGGTGLGLAISRKLVELMGGRISVQSETGSGSTFTFGLQLPIAREPVPSPLTNARPENVAPDREQLRDLPVLLVAEQISSRLVLQRILASWSMQVDTADEVPAALVKLHQAAANGSPYRLVLADAVTTGVDGLALAEWIARTPQLAGAVILMVSAADRRDHLERCRAVDAICVEKPISRSSLLQVVGRAAGIVSATAGEVAEAPKAAEAEPAVAIPQRHLRILLAEDTPANQKLVQFLLGKRGHTVVVAETGQEAVDLVTAQDFDVVLMDVQMPVLDGLQATAEIRRMSDARRAGLPIIAMTAYAMKSDRQRCLAAGMSGYISKPIDGNELIALVEGLAAPAELPTPEPLPPVAARELPPDGPPSDDLPPDEPSLAEPPAFDFDRALRRCLDDREMLGEMVEGVFAESGSLIQRIRAALRNGDAKELFDAAHRLKNLLLYLEVTRALQAIHRVEQIASSGDLADAGPAVEQLIHEADRVLEALDPLRTFPPSGC